MDLDKTLNDFLYKSSVFDDRLNHIESSIHSRELEGCILEFGVWQGLTINYIADHCQGDNIHGFDSFMGLPEKWVRSFDGSRLSQKGEFSLPTPPNIRTNVNLHVGWFKDSIPIWKRNHHETLSLIHIDCDLYSSTTTILNELNNRILKGCIIILDELVDWNNQGVYDRWRDGEWKALYDWCKSKNRKIKPLSRTEWIEGAVIVEK